MLIAFNKPYGVISQFTEDGSKNATLSQFNFPPEVYPIGRLDADSEGLLLLTDEKTLNFRLLNPKNQHKRTYWAQVEGIPSEEKFDLLRKGVKIDGRQTLPCRAWILNPQPEIPERIPPIRYRRNSPTYWIAIELIEGKNRQVRKMTASVGHPTLRLIRVQIGSFSFEIPQGTWQVLSPKEREQIFN